MSDRTTKSDSTSRYCNRLQEALAEAGCWMAEDWGDQHNSADCDACTIDAAARRFLALTETRPEKRWCVKHDCEGLGNPDRGEVGCTGAGVGRAVDMDCRLIPVYLIPADYLTEEP